MTAKKTLVGRHRWLLWTSLALAMTTEEEVEQRLAPILWHSAVSDQEKQVSASTKIDLWFAKTKNVSGLGYRPL